MTAESAGRTAAADFRVRHRLGMQALGDLITLIEQTTQHDVAILEVGPDEHGLTMCDPDRGTVFIGVARTPHPMRQRSTLAHELAHVVFEDYRKAPGAGTRRSFEEIRADAFARHLLAPVAAVKDFLGDRKDVSTADLSSVVQKFLVSPSVAVIVMCEAGYLDVKTKKSWMQLSTHTLAARFGWADHYRTLQHESDRTRPPRRLLARAIAGYSEGVVSAQVVATLRGVGVETVVEDLEEAGVFPCLPEVPWVSASDMQIAPVDTSDLDETPPEGVCE